MGIKSQAYPRHYWDTSKVMSRYFSPPMPQLSPALWGGGHGCKWLVHHLGLCFSFHVIRFCFNKLFLVLSSILQVFLFSHKIIWAPSGLFWENLILLQSNKAGSKPAHPHSLFVPVWKVQKVTQLITPKVLTYRGYLLFWGEYRIYFIECGEKN